MFPKVFFYKKISPGRISPSSRHGGERDPFPPDFFDDCGTLRGIDAPPITMLLFSTLMCYLSVSRIKGICFFQDGFRCYDSIF